MGDHVVQFPRDPGALLQHGPPGLLQLGALGLGGQGPLGTPPGTDAVHGDRPGGEQRWWQLSGPFRSARSLASHSRPGDEGQRPHPPQHRPPVADPGHAEHRQQHQQLRRAPRPASPPLTRDQRGKQQREPPEPPAQQRIPGREQQRRHHRHGQQDLPDAERRVVEVITGAGAAGTGGRGSGGGLRVDAGQVRHAQRQRRQHQRDRCPAPPRRVPPRGGRVAGRPAPGSARATPGAPPRGCCSPPAALPGILLTSLEGRPPAAAGSSPQRGHTQVSVSARGRAGLPPRYDRRSGSVV